MRKLLLACCFGVAALFTAGYAFANDELAKIQNDPKQWVMPARRHRQHALLQAQPDQRRQRQQAAAAWTFSTGVLRGHEGAPLVIGDMMYVHTPFPNTVYALDLNNDGKILWKYEPRQDPNVIPIMCCDTVNRGVAYADGKIFLHQADTTLVALDAKTGKVVWSVMDGEAGKGQTGTDAPFVFKDKVLIGVSGGEFGVRGWVSAYEHQGRQAGLARLFRRAGHRHSLIDPRQDDVARQAGRRRTRRPQDLGGRPVEDRRRRHLGLVFLRSRS